MPIFPAHALVAKLSPDASKTIWWTNSGRIEGRSRMGLAIGPGNSVYMTGKTQSTDFPTTPGTLLGRRRGNG
jgi:hypothetical protein